LRGPFFDRRRPQLARRAPVEASYNQGHDKEPEESAMTRRNDPDGLRLPIKLDSTSNGEFCPVPLQAQHFHARRLALEAATRNARKLGLSRRDFLVSASGAATTLLAMNAAYAAAGRSGGFFALSAESALGARGRDVTSRSGGCITAPALPGTLDHLQCLCLPGVPRSVRGAATTVRVLLAMNRLAGLDETEFDTMQPRPQRSQQGHYRGGFFAAGRFSAMETFPAALRKRPRACPT
jgi:hypothetical protein